MARVSIIVPTHNCAQWIGRAIQSVLSQTFDDFELIVVNDGSTDNTKEVISHFAESRIRYEVLPENRGVHAARNRGMELALGDIIVFLDADDELAPDALARCVSKFDSLPSDVGVLYANGITDDGELTGLLIKASRMVSLRELLCATVFCRYKNCFGAVRKSCLKSTRWVLQGFDFVFWRRMQKHCQTYALAEVLLCYHRNSNPESLTTLRSNPEHKYRQAPQASKIYEEFLSEMGGELEDLCPDVYITYLWGLAATSLLAGRRRMALRATQEFLKHRRTWKAVGVLALLLMPHFIIRKWYMRGTGEATS